MFEKFHDKKRFGMTYKLKISINALRFYFSKSILHEHTKSIAHSPNYQSKDCYCVLFSNKKINVVVIKIYRVLLQCTQKISIKINGDKERGKSGNKNNKGV